MINLKYNLRFGFADAYVTELGLSCDLTPLVTIFKQQAAEEPERDLWAPDEPELATKLVGMSEDELLNFLTTIGVVTGIKAESLNFASKKYFKHVCEPENGEGQEIPYFEMFGLEIVYDGELLPTDVAEATEELTDVADEITSEATDVNETIA